ncbi:MAG: tRNA uracil 4-sulfurtransferase ThiI [Bacilli bacterium]|jgi:thiamine biosynthesis protein ThiI
MKYDHIMIRYGELSTKGKNKKDFIRILARNIKSALSPFDKLSYDVRYDHIYIALNDEENTDDIIHVLQSVSGIHAISLVMKIDDDIEEIKRASLEIVRKENGSSFKIRVKRANKAYPITSDKVIRIVAEVILSNTTLKVDVHNPDILLNIEIREEGAYIFTDTIQCSGGYPLGIIGKAMMMISGGIDSPVASYLLLKRGVKIECIHFASPPYTNIGVIEKLKDILSVLNTFQDEIKLNIIPFTKIQEAIYANSDESYAITIMRRMMYRIAERLAAIRRCSIIANGESIGQVASQTLESMKVINECIKIPVIRPLAAYDKLDIIKVAKTIGTYDISIRPFEDCCTIFSPKNPKTKPRLSECEHFESRFDYKSLIDEAIQNVEMICIKKDS